MCQYNEKEDLLHAWTWAPWTDNIPTFVLDLFQICVALTMLIQGCVYRKSKRKQDHGGDEEDTESLPFLEEGKRKKKNKFKVPMEAAGAADCVYAAAKIMAVADAAVGPPSAKEQEDHIILHPGDAKAVFVEEDPSGVRTIA